MMKQCEKETPYFFYVWHFYRILTEDAMHGSSYENDDQCLFCSIIEEETPHLPTPLTWYHLYVFDVMNRNY